MFNPHEIDAQNRQTNTSESISEESRSVPQISKRERNDNPVSRFFALLEKGKNSRKAAIFAKCAECVGCTAKEQGKGEEDWVEPGFRKLIAECTAHGCPLWLYRPYQ